MFLAPIRFRGMTDVATLPPNVENDSLGGSDARAERLAYEKCSCYRDGLLGVTFGVKETGPELGIRHDHQYPIGFRLRRRTGREDQQRCLWW